MVALPFCHITLKAQKPLIPQYPTEIKTLGDHLRKRRLDLKLFQREAAEIIGVSKSGYENWETNRLNPMFWYYPKIIEFLGYLPFKTNGLSTGEKIVLYRKSKGISQFNFARQLGIDPSTLARWEKGRGKPRKS